MSLDDRLFDGKGKGAYLFISLSKHCIIKLLSLDYGSY